MIVPRTVLSISNWGNLYFICFYIIIMQTYNHPTYTCNVYSSFAAAETCTSTRIFGVAIFASTAIHVQYYTFSYL